MKSILKESKFIVSIYGYIIGLISLFSPVFASRIRYRSSMGKKMNMENPKGFNEKLMWLNLYDKNPLKTKCSDKLLVREYVEEKNCGKILNKLYSVYQKVDDIEWDQLPESFALKCTYGAGVNVICSDKKELNISKAETILKKGLRPKLLNTTAEMHYSSKTNKIICEEYIETDDGLLPNDYKVYCFNGEPKAILAMKGREGDISKKFYDLNWKPLNEYSNKETCKGEFDKPENLNLLVQYARKLSEDFSFVRVDLYDTGERVVFGELTFTPAGCLSKAHNLEGDKYFGQLLELPINVD